ncbi:MAG: 50S ribosomal protein L11 methyltransferase [Parvibaculum sp.]|nr:50S ribosomal protein L11 methyltransferase [Parvibaculum sp.]
MSEHQTSQPLWQISFTVENKWADAFVAELENAPWLTPIAITVREQDSSAQTIEVAHPAGALATTGAWRIEAIYDQQLHLSQIRNTLLPLEDFIGTKATRLRMEILPNLDWVRHSLKLLPSVRIGKFEIHGAHTSPKTASNITPLLIEAGPAFGTGHHATTAGSAAALLDVLGRKKGKQRVCDAGCGSGILSIIAAKKHNVQVWAFDIDPYCVATSRNNAAINGIARKITTFQHSIDKPLYVQQKFDVVVANVLFNPLLNAATRLTAITAKRGTLILSGYDRTQFRRIESRYRSLGMRVVRRYITDDWITTSFSKISNH